MTDAGVSVRDESVKSSRRSPSPSKKPTTILSPKHDSPTSSQYLKKRGQAADVFDEFESPPLKITSRKEQDVKTMSVESRGFSFLEPNNDMMFPFSEGEMELANPVMPKEEQRKKFAIMKKPRGERHR